MSSWCPSPCKQNKLLSAQISPRRKVYTLSSGDVCHRLMSTHLWLPFSRTPWPLPYFLSLDHTHLRTWPSLDLYLTIATQLYIVKLSQTYETLPKNCDCVSSRYSRCLQAHIFLDGTQTHSLAQSKQNQSRHAVMTGKHSVSLWTEAGKMIE